ncbi:hypothetical protein SD340_004301 [Vibrio fluvialis]|nr:hypothetical protein [Vibrio fluvialis]ELU8402387.1 hypothetical protein [Vibrio fluvialis]
MNKKAYYRKLIEIRQELNKPSFRYLFDSARIFEPANKKMSGGLSYQAITGRNQESLNQRDSITALLQQSIEKDKKDVSTRKLVRCSIDVENFIEETMSLDYVPDLLTDKLSSLIHYLDSFLDLHERYRMTFDISMAFQLSERASTLFSIRNDIEFMIDILLQAYTPKKIEEDKKNLELYLPNVPTLKQFGVKLQVLDEMYSEVCMLLDLSLSENPLVIEHIENGSLLARISGSNLAIGIITTILNVSAGYYISNYPVNGEIIEIKEKIETLDKMYELTKKLQEEGYDVVNMQDDINRSLKKLSKSTDILLGDQPTIEVNDEVYELDEANKTKLLEESKRKLLENKDYKNEA